MYILWSSGFVVVRGFCCSGTFVLSLTTRAMCQAAGQYLWHVLLVPDSASTFLTH